MHRPWPLQHPFLKLAAVSIEVSSHSVNWLNLRVQCLQKDWFFFSFLGVTSTGYIVTQEQVFVQSEFRVASFRTTGTSDFFFNGAGIERRALWMLARHCNTVLYPQSNNGPKFKTRLKSIPTSGFVLEVVFLLRMFCFVCLFAWWWVVIYFFIYDRYHFLPWLSWNRLCRTGWLWTHNALPHSDWLFLESKAYTTIKCFFFRLVYYHKHFFQNVKCRLTATWQEREVMILLRFGLCVG